MIIDIEKHKKIDEAGAFYEVMSFLRGECQDVFAAQIGIKSGWLDETDQRLLPHLRDSLFDHAEKIKDSTFERKDIIDLVIYAAMIYNIVE